MDDILAYEMDLDFETQYLCRDCGAEAQRGWDYFEGVVLIPITDPAKLPEGPSGLGYECDGPFCGKQRLPVSR